MKPQKQIHANGCIQACVASLIDYRIDKVPNFVEAPEVEGQDYPGWWLALQSWLNELGLFFLEVQLPENFPWQPLPLPALGIFFGTTANGTKHAVVGRMEDDKFVPIFNPHPTGAALTKVEGLGFILPRDPVSYVRMGHCLSKIHRLSAIESNLVMTPGAVVQEIHSLASHALQEQQQGFSLNGKKA
jgi:hypothetical protein